MLKMEIFNENNVAIPSFDVESFNHMVESMGDTVKLWFNQIGHTYQSTAYLHYMFANSFKEFFKQKIYAMDVDRQFSRLRFEEGYSDLVKNQLKAEYEKKYEDQLAALRLWQMEMQKVHPDWYRMQPCLPTDNAWHHAFAEFAKGYGDDLTLEQCVQGYKACNEILKEVDNSTLDDFCICTKPMLNYEHRDDYNLEKTEKMENLQLPDLKTFSDRQVEKYPEKYAKENLPKFRLALNRAKCEDWSVMRHSMEKMMLNFI